MSRRAIASVCLATGTALIVFACADTGHTNPDASPEAPVAETRATMGEILDALAFLLPASLDEERFSDPDARQEILGATKTLRDRAALLETHAQSDDTFRHLSRSLARDASEIHRRFEAGRVRETRFLLRNLTNDCVACHSRLPSPRVTNLGQRLTNRIDLDDLPPQARAHLLVATRQFDAALDTYEALFLDPRSNPARLDYDGHFRDYLVVCLRVKDDVDRPHRMLESLMERGDLPAYLRWDAAIWIETLERLAKPTTGTELERARKLVDEAGSRLEFPTDQTGLVHDLAASGLLHRFIAGAPTEAEQIAEAYFLLGVTEYRTMPFYWLSQTEFYLETSIRTAPRATFARRAYALLEEHTIAGYSGSSGIHLPDDVRVKLEELEALVNGAHTP